MDTRCLNTNPNQQLGVPFKYAITANNKRLFDVISQVTLYFFLASGRTLGRCA